MALVINGTPGDDIIHISPSGSGIRVTINGIANNYAVTGRIIVYAFAGNDDVQVAGSIANEAWLYGDTGNDKLNLGNGGGIVFGGTGDDQINGGNGRDILVGGDGSDKLVGNSADDILLAAFSDYDDRFTSPVHEDAWRAIFEEWKRTDHDYLQRVANINSGNGTPLDRSNEAYFLNLSTVHDDDDEDILTGSAGRDWFFANLYGTGVLDKVTGQNGDEIGNDL